VAASLILDPELDNPLAVQRGRSNTRRVAEGVPPELAAAEEQVKLPCPASSFHCVPVHRHGKWRRSSSAGPKFSVHNSVRGKVPHRAVL